MRKRIVGLAGAPGHLRDRCARPGNDRDYHGAGRRSARDHCSHTINGRTLFHWTVTGLMAAFMVMSSVPDVTQSAGAVAAISHLGYPVYLLPFLGVAKIAGVVAIVYPSPGWLKEWAYAGLVFDLTGALYSHLSVGDSAGTWMFAVIGLALVAGSYLLVPPRPVRAMRE